MSDDSCSSTPRRHRYVVVVFVVVLPNGDVAVFDNMEDATSFSESRGGRLHEAEVNERVREGVRLPSTPSSPPRCNCAPTGLGRMTAIMRCANFRCPMNT
jgi:hypothetical protein